MQAPSPDSGYDVENATSIDQLSALMRQLHLASGEMSTRDFERWARGQQMAGRTHIQMSRTTISEVLAGRRLASAAFLSAFLESCGVTGEAAQRPWLAARARIATSRSVGEPRSIPLSRPAAEERPGPANLSAAGSVSGADPVPLPTQADRPRTRRRLPYFTAVAVTVVAAALLVLTYWPSPQVETTMGCLPAACVITGGRVTMTGRLSGHLPENHEAVLLTQVEGTMRWYIGPAVMPAADGTWASGVGIGNPVPQSHDRQFLICVYLLPSDSLDPISQLMIARHGDGLKDTDLPVNRTRLACVSVIRLAST